MKFKTESGSAVVSFTQVPGLGSGTLFLKTGNQAALALACSLNFPAKASWMLLMEYEHMAEPIRPSLEPVVNAA